MAVLNDHCGYSQRNRVLNHTVIIGAACIDLCLDAPAVQAVLIAQLIQHQIPDRIALGIVISQRWDPPLRKASEAPLCCSGD